MRIPLPVKENIIPLAGETKILWSDATFPVATLLRMGMRQMTVFVICDQACSLLRYNGNAAGLNLISTTALAAGNHTINIALDATPLLALALLNGGVNQGGTFRVELEANDLLVKC